MHSNILLPSSLQLYTDYSADKLRRYSTDNVSLNCTQQIVLRMSQLADMYAYAKFYYITLNNTKAVINN